PSSFREPHGRRPRRTLRFLALFEVQRSTLILAVHRQTFAFRCQNDDLRPGPYHHAHTGFSIGTPPRKLGLRKNETENAGRRRPLTIAPPLVVGHFALTRRDRQPLLVQETEWVREAGSKDGGP